MRLLVFLSLLIATAASAQSTDTVRLATGEVPLRIVADGKARTPADEVVITVPVTGSGATVALAHAATQATVAQITAALTGAGVPASAIASGQPASPVGFIGNEAADEDGPVAIAAAAAARAAAAQRTRQSSLVVRVVLADPATLPRVEQALDAIDQSFGTPLATLKDDRVGRQAAVADAAAHARAEADAYAAALNMRVARVLAVSDSPAGNDLASGWTVFAAIQGLAPPTTEVETRRRIQIDYALVQR